MKRRILAAAACIVALTTTLTLTGCDIPVDEATSALGALASAASDMAENANVGDTIASAAEAADINDETTSTIKDIGEKADDAISGILDFAQGVIGELQEGTDGENVSSSTASESEADAEGSDAASDTAKSNADTAKTDADTSKSDADTAKSDADTAKPDADTTSATDSQVLQDTISDAAEALDELGNKLSGVMDSLLSDAESTATSTSNS